MKQKIFILCLFLFATLFAVEGYQTYANACNPDTEAPVIIGAEDLYHEIGQPIPNYLANIKVTDNCGKYVLYLSYEHVNLSKPGKYPLYYYADDSAGNSTTATVYVHVKEDMTAPVFHSVKDLTVEYGSELTEDFFLEGVVAIDAKEGDVTDQVVVDYSMVDTSVIGDYQVSYSVDDGHGNIQEEIITLTVVDRTAPVITGHEDFSIEVGTPIIDFIRHAVANDSYDGELTITVDSASVDVNTLGEYSVTLSATDASGNTVSETITITVKDSLAPVFEGVEPFEIEVFSNLVNYIRNAKAIDAYEGEVDITVDASNVNLNLLGEYDVILTAKDSTGNETTATFKVKVVDHSAPTLEGIEDLELPVFSDPYDFLSGVTATDNYDDTIEVFVDASAVIYDQTGTYPVVFTATDASGNKTTETIQVTITDKTAPTIDGHKDIQVEVGTSVIDYLDGVTANDEYDGVLTIAVDDSEVQLNKVGVYHVTLTATDSSNNVTTKTITITVVDTTAPILTGHKDLTVEVMTPSIDYLKDLVATDNYDQELTIVVDDTLVQLNRVGVYQVTFTVTDASNNKTTETITVTVVDTTAPTITGHKDLTLEVFTEGVNFEGVTATDLYDGDVEVTVDFSHVDLTKLGTYTVTFTATDALGNTSTVTIEVEVVDTTAPIIEGAKDHTIEVFSPIIDFLKDVIASDLYDGELEVIVDASTVRYDQLGHYTVTYTAIDKSGNEETKTITVTVVDTTAPEFIYFQSVIRIPVGPQALSYTHQLYVVDNYDGVMELGTIKVYDEYVNYEVDGIYPLTYVVSDSSGNTSSQTVFVQIVDEVAPTFEGPDRFSVPKGIENFNYHRLIEVTDNLTGTIIDEIKFDDSEVNYDVLGVYPMRFVVTDRSGNITIIDREVEIVEDQTAPVIEGHEDFTVEVGTPSIDYLNGVIAIDALDGPVAVTVDASSVNLNALGEYTITYKAIDASGNETTVSVKVNVVDTQKPTLTGSPTLVIEVNTNNPDYLAGLIATDTVDDHVEISIQTGSVDITKTGEYTLTIVARDDSGNEVTFERVVKVVDNKKPQVTVKEIVLEVGGPTHDYFDDFIVSDNYDTHPTISIDGSNINVSEIGVYKGTYTVTDSSNNVTTGEFTVTVVDRTKPVISLSDDQYLTIREGDSFVPLFDGISVSDNYDENVFVTYEGDYDTKKAGEYTIKLIAQDQSGNTSEVTYTLTVEKNNNQTWIIIGYIACSVVILGLGTYVITMNRKKEIE